MLGIYASAFMTAARVREPVMPPKPTRRPEPPRAATPPKPAAR
jgi:hypothetical protein